jgi:hypothetical protein
MDSIDKSMLRIYHLVSFSKQISVSYIYSVVSQKIVHGKILTSNLVLLGAALENFETKIFH